MPTESSSKKVCETCRTEFDLHSDVAVCPVDNTVLAVILDRDLVGTVLANDYRIDELVYKGNWSIHYRAMHLPSSEFRTVVVFIHEHVNEPEQRSLFQARAQALSTLKHPNLVRMYDYGVLNEGLPYLVFEQSEGQVFWEISGGAAMKPGTVVDLFVQLCDGLSELHSHDLVHGNLKPSNIIITRTKDGTDVLKIGNFSSIHPFSRRKIYGINATKSATLLDMTPYMSPEQCVGGDVTTQSDIYSAGCMLYQCLTGKRPFEATNDADLMLKHASAAMPLPFKALRQDLALPVVLEGITFKSITKDPESRYKSAFALKIDLERARASIEAPIVVSAFGSMLGMRKEQLRRKQVLVRVGKLIGVGAIVVLVCLMIVYSITH